MMAKTTPHAVPLTSVTLNYDLFDLPTAQHKAGLAGLVLQANSMKARKCDAATIPDVVVTPTSARVTLTERSAHGLFDDLYDAQTVEIAVRSKWQGKPPKRVEESVETDEDGEARTVKKFIYEVTQPRGHFLRQHLPDQDGVWLKLWRDMLWAIPRGNPQARIPFEQRAAGKCCKEGQDAWRDLIKVENARRKNGFFTCEVASSLWLGAQAANAESIPFEGRAEQNLLLHFWPLTVLLFVPQVIDMDGGAEFLGYVLAIPEVTDLESFLEEYPTMLSQLGTEKRGYRPAECVIDLPAQGALAFLEHLARLSQQKAGRTSIRMSVGQIEFLHMVKVGNNIKSMAAGRVAPSEHLLEQYEAVVGRVGNPAPYRNPLFRRCLMLGLLNEKPWSDQLSSTFAERPWPFFVRSQQSPSKLPWFWQDAAEWFRACTERFENDKMRCKAMSQPDPRTPLEVLIHRLVQNYVNRRTEERSGLKWESFGKIKDEKTGKQRIDVPEPYREAREKVASSAFLELRSRREQAFIDHFTATFCSVRQYLPEEDFAVVAKALVDRRADVKTYTLLALSANS
jgi:CRISPR-associated protein Cmx8